MSDPKRLLALAALLLAPAPLWAQASPYVSETTTVVRGREFCGANPRNTDNLDTVVYSVAGASEFSVCGPAVFGGAARPMGGRDRDETTGPYFAVSVVNPGAAPLTVTEVRVATAGAQLFRNALGVKPAPGWAVQGNTTLRWTAAAAGAPQVVPPHSALDFIVRTGSNRQAAAAEPLTLTAVTLEAFTLTNAGTYATTALAAVAPMLSLYYVENGAPAYVAASTNGGQVVSGQSKAFHVQLLESETGNTTPIPAGSKLRIEFPPGWSRLTPVPGSDFTVDEVVEPDCARNPGHILASTRVPLLGSTLDFRFSATSPASLGSAGFFVLPTFFYDAAAPAQAARADLVVEVSPPPPSGSYAGLTARGVHAIVPRPMGHRKAGVFGASVANPTAGPLTVTALSIRDVSAAGLFRSVIPVRPASGWSVAGSTEVRWSGSVTIDPRRGLDFIALVQANGLKRVSGAPVEITATTSAGVLRNTDGTTAQDKGPFAGLYYRESGLPAGYVPGVANGGNRRFRVVVEESEGGKLKKGALLRIQVPAGWSTVSAEPGQKGFDTPAIVQPGPATPGEITVRLQKDLITDLSEFRFSAQAPAGVLQSLYVFPTTLEDPAAGILSLCQLVVQTVEPSGGGLQVDHVSQQVLDTRMRQIDVHLNALSVGPEEYTLQIRNFASSDWETLGTATFSSTARNLVGSITRSFPDYLDAGQRLTARVVSSARGCHNLHEDLVRFLVSRYGVDPVSVAPPTTVQGASQVPLEHVRFSTDEGTVTLETLRLVATGSAPASDVARLILVEDRNCSGYIEAGEPVLGSSALGPGAAVRFGLPGNPLLSFRSGQDACIIVAADVALAAGAGNLIGVRVESGLDITTDVGPYPVPSRTGYPFASDLVLLLVLDQDRDGIPDADERAGGVCTSELDADTDDDGLLDGEEDLLGTDPCNPDTDGDGLQDGLEESKGAFPVLTDSDGDGTPDIVDPEPGNRNISGTNASLFTPDLDTTTNTDALDDDSDDDGLMDGPNGGAPLFGEDLNANGRADNVIGGTGSTGSGETDPTLIDTDGDGCQDGTELGLVLPQGAGTRTPPFQPDLDPTTTTSAVDSDTDDDGLLDGEEDRDCNGRVDPGETDPNSSPGPDVLRNDETTRLDRASPPFATIFVGSGANSLDPLGLNGLGEVGEGPTLPDEQLPGSQDDDDLYRKGVAAPWREPDPSVVGDARRPLVFYQLAGANAPLLLAKSGGGIEARW